jgi:colanic acid/amylovoran biosynthesis glycosyltransferase
MNTTITQSLATGMPVIATVHSGFPDQVKDGVNGWLVPEGDPRALAERIIFYMEHSDLWPEMSRASRAHALKHYDSKALIGKQAEFYKKILKDGGG